MDEDKRGGLVSETEEFSLGDWLRGDPIGR